MRIGEEHEAREGGAAVARARLAFGGAGPPGSGDLAARSGAGGAGFGVRLWRAIVSPGRARRRERSAPVVWSIVAWVMAAAASSRVSNVPTVFASTDARKRPDGVRADAAARGGGRRAGAGCAGEGVALVRPRRGVAPDALDFGGMSQREETAGAARAAGCATAVGHRKLFGDAETRGDPRQCATRAILSDAPHIAARRSRRASTASPTPRARVPIAMAEPRVLSFEVRPASSPSLARVVSRRVVVPPPLFPPPTRTRALMPDEPVPPPHRPAPSLVPTRRRSPVEA